MSPCCQLLRWAEEQFAEGDYETVMELTDIGLRRHPSHPGLLQLRGLAAVEVGQIDEAAHSFEAASLEAPLHPMAQLTLASIYVQLGYVRSARAILCFLAEPDRCPVTLWPQLSKLLGQAGRYKAALRVCQRLVRLRPWYHPAHYGVAYYLGIMNGPTSKIIHHLHAAHLLAPDAILYRVALANELAIFGEYLWACDLIRDLPLQSVTCPKVLVNFLFASHIVEDRALTMAIRNRLIDFEQDQSGRTN